MREQHQQLFSVLSLQHNGGPLRAVQPCQVRTGNGRDPEEGLGHVPEDRNQTRKQRERSERRSEALQVCLDELVGLRQV